MSDFIGHECGVAAVRLLKPLEYYTQKYGSPLYAVNKLYLMLEKQRNRGQDGTGAVAVKLDTEPGEPYIARARSVERDPTTDVYEHMRRAFDEAREKHPEQYADPVWLKKNIPFAGEVLLGHLRYGTHGHAGVGYCHPFLRQNNWMTRNLVVAGNFNLTNNDELFDLLVDLGQHPRNRADTVMMMEKIGHFLDESNDRIFRKYRKEGVDRAEISQWISKELDIAHILRSSVKDFDGGYAICGIIGNGDLFVLRDPCGIRPAFYYQDEEVVVVASERPAIQTAFGVTIDQVREVAPGHALIVRHTGEVSHESIQTSELVTPCSFERIYFSRGTDGEIYHERKKLGRNLCAPILKRIGYDFENTVFSYIPNTSETAFLGLMEAMRESFGNWLKGKLLGGEEVTPEKLDAWLSARPRMEKIMTKDAKLRTFIATDEKRNEMVALAYDTTYGVIRRNRDTLVVLDDSIVRGTTLRESILRILDRLEPRKVIVVSSAPQIRYPDCYGIDMSKLKDFVAFQAAVELLRENGREAVLNETYQACKADEQRPRKETVNRVKKLYAGFSEAQLSAKIAALMTPNDMRAEVEVIYQSIEGLHDACPNHQGDWYFTGNYPTAGGNRVANRSFINFMENCNDRAY